MKKIFAVLLTVTLLLSMALPVMAEPIETPWVKFMGATDVTTSTEDGATVYSFSNITNTYISAGVDIMPVLKTLIEGNDQITVKISMDIKIDYNADFEGQIESLEERVSTIESTLSGLGFMYLYKLGGNK